MKRLILTVMVMFFCTVLMASTPSLTLQTTYTETIASGSSYTKTLSSVALAGDSIGIMLSFNKDSVSGWITYQYISPDGYSDGATSTTMTVNNAGSPGTTFTVAGGNQAVFSTKVPVLAGTYYATFNVVLYNNAYNSRAITTKIYTITWR